ncbi:MAG: hypothetical protein DIU68_018700 [Chloroflexota bacterium]|nr:MAG: hypothetical protein DIU68_11410 [Chloroflexota bacterium]
MNTSTEAVSRLQEALGATRAAGQVIDDLIVAHDYQDIASLVVRAAEALLEAASQLMQSQDEAALEAIERADDFLDAVYDIIDGEIGDEEEA